MNILMETKKIITELTGLNKIKKCSSLQEDLGLDSLAMVSLLIRIEEQFDIELDESDMNPYDLTTVEDVILLIKKYQHIENI